ncbi:MAG: FmdB family transcriptional regulator [Actinobacteria bacterium 21-73-9]|nr:MAG: FmdB family transcriptional regulator [Actinobacteria bacterium 21-73-9]
MPTYEYECQSCHERHEAVQRFSDAPLTECPRCGGPLRRVFSSVGIVFKGGGFYKTDSRPSGSSSSTPAPSPAAKPAPATAPAAAPAAGASSAD